MTYPTPSGRVLQLSHDNTVLFLPGVSSDDAVSYTVTAANSHGTRSLTFKVVVRSGLQSGEVILPVYDEISAQVGTACVELFRSAFSCISIVNGNFFILTTFLQNLFLVCRILLSALCLPHLSQGGRNSKNTSIDPEPHIP